MWEYLTRNGASVPAYKARISTVMFLEESLNLKIFLYETKNIKLPSIVLKPPPGRILNQMLRANLNLAAEKKHWVAQDVPKVLRLVAHLA